MTDPELPAGWCSTKLGAIADVRLGKMLSPKAFEHGLSQLPYLRNENVRWGHINFSDVKLMGFKPSEIERYRVESGDLLVCEGGEPGRASLFTGRTGQYMYQKALHRVRPREGAADAKFLQLFFQHGARRAPTSQTTIAHLPLERMLTLEVPLPPLREQTRIVAEADKQFTRLDAGVAALKRVQALLKHYRASVLKAACEGRLVPTEADLARREKRDYEPADKLLARILKDRRVRWEADQLAKMKAAGKLPKDDGWKAKYVEALAPQVSTLGEPPAGWQWATVEQLAELVTDGDHNPPKRVQEGVPHLTAKHVKRWRISTADCTFVSHEDFQKTRARYEPLAGDLIVTCVGTVGETAIVPDGLTFSADRNLAGIRLPPDGVLTRYLQIALGSPTTFSLLRTVSGSTAQPHLYLGDLRAVAIPVPPLAEQRRILEETDRLLSLCSANTDQVEVTLARARRLGQSVLRHAFLGRLVSQDPSDQPASKLLERIPSAALNEHSPKALRTKRAVGAPKKKTTA